MSIKLFIDVEREPVFPDRVAVEFDLNKRSKHTPHMIRNDAADRWEVIPYGFLTLGQDRRFWYEDEWFDGNLGAVMAGDREGGRKTWRKFVDMNFEERRAFLQALAGLTDERIQSFINNAWYRPVPYWKMYRMLTKAYMMAKRDYLRALVAAGISGIHVMAVFVPAEDLYDDAEQEDDPAAAEGR